MLHLKKKIEYSFVSVWWCAVEVTNTLPVYICKLNFTPALPRKGSILKVNTNLNSRFHYRSANIFKWRKASEADHSASTIPLNTHIARLLHVVMPSNWIQSTGTKHMFYTCPVLKAILKLQKNGKPVITKQFKQLKTTCLKWKERPFFFVWLLFIYLQQYLPWINRKQ